MEKFPLGLYKVDVVGLTCRQLALNDAYKNFKVNTPLSLQFIHLHKKLTLIIYFQILAKPNVISWNDMKDPFLPGQC